MSATTSDAKPVIADDPQSCVVCADRDAQTSYHDLRLCDQMFTICHRCEEGLRDSLEAMCSVGRRAWRTGLDEGREAERTKQGGSQC